MGKILMIDLCPECQCPISHYNVGDWTETICWNCGHYESNSPAFVSDPARFKDMVRKDPQYFFRKFLVEPSDGFLQRKKPDKDFTEP
jgi:hypothetical protein